MLRVANTYLFWTETQKPSRKRVAGGSCYDKYRYLRYTEPQEVTRSVSGLFLGVLKFRVLLLNVLEQAF